jgi:predicted enzyme related to lactoylglutathione lyase
MPPTNAITWFEIPTTDLPRAVAFYERVLATKLNKFDHDPTDIMHMFPADEKGLKGALINRTFMKPGGCGAMVYLNVDGDLDGAIARVPQAGGRMLIPRTDVPGGMGSYACFRDTEGNAVGLHSTK